VPLKQRMMETGGTTGRNVVMWYNDVHAAGRDMHSLQAPVRRQQQVATPPAGLDRQNVAQLFCRIVYEFSHCCYGQQLECS